MQTPLLFCLQKTWVWVSSLPLTVKSPSFSVSISASSTSLDEGRMKYWMSEPLKRKSTESRGVSLKLQHVSESPGGLVKTQLAGSHPQNFGFGTFHGRGRGEKIAFPLSV